MKKYIYKTIDGITFKVLTNCNPDDSIQSRELHRAELKIALKILERLPGYEGFKFVRKALGYTCKQINYSTGLKHKFVEAFEIESDIAADYNKEAYEAYRVFLRKECVNKLLALKYSDDVEIATM